MLRTACTSHAAFAEHPEGVGSQLGLELTGSSIDLLPVPSDGISRQKSRTCWATLMIAEMMCVPALSTWFASVQPRWYTCEHEQPLAL